MALPRIASPHFIFSHAQLPSIFFVAEIIDGNKIAAEILKDLTLQLRSGKKFQPRLVVVLAGENPASLSYIKIKQKKAEEIGITIEVKKYPEDIPQQELQNEIWEAGREGNGIIVQLPLPAHMDKQAVLDTIPPELDVDCLTAANKQRLIEGKEIWFVPPAAGAVLQILDYHKVDLKDKHVLLVGSGDLVGKPLASLLLHRGVNFKIANRYTENLADLAKNADVIITGAGKPGLVTGEMVKQNSVIIDAGTTGSGEGEITGDVDFESVKGKASLIAPVPGGVGPVTVAMLLANVLRAAQGFDRKYPAI